MFRLLFGKKGPACVRARRTQRHPTTRGGLRISHSWPLTAGSPRTPLSKGIKGRQAFSLTRQGRESPVAEAGATAAPGLGGPPWNPGPDDPDLGRLRVGPSELRGARLGVRGEGGPCPRGGARPPAPGPRCPPAHRHGRRVQREALVVVVPRPVQ